MLNHILATILPAGLAASACHAGPRHPAPGLALANYNNAGFTSISFNTGMVDELIPLGPSAE